MVDTYNSPSNVVFSSNPFASASAPSSPISFSESLYVEVDNQSMLRQRTIHHISNRKLHVRESP